MEGKESNVNPSNTDAIVTGLPNTDIKWITGINKSTKELYEGDPKSKYMFDEQGVFPKIKWEKTVPLLISWEPKEDITVFELAQCQELLLLMVKGPVMPLQVNFWDVWMRHFKIVDLNK